MGSTRPIHLTTFLPLAPCPYNRTLLPDSLKLRSLLVSTVMSICHQFHTNLFLNDLCELLFAVGTCILDGGPLFNALHTEEVATVDHSLVLEKLLGADRALWGIILSFLLFFDGGVIAAVFGLDVQEHHFWQRSLFAHNRVLLKLYIFGDGVLFLKERICDFRLFGLNLVMVRVCRDDITLREYKN